MLAEPQKRFKVIETGYKVVKKQDFHDERRTFGKIVYKPNRRTHERPVSAGVSATDGRADMGLLLIFIHRCFVLSSECF